MEFETIIDQKGKEHMVFNAEELNNDELMGDKPEDFEFLQILGEGSFGKVVKVSSLINHKIYAMKILRLKEKEGDQLTKELKQQYFESEIALLKKLNHPNIVKYYKSFREGDNLYIIMEYFDNGDLKDYIKALKYEKKKNKKEEIWNIFYQCLSGLNYLHSLGVIHRDIKPENIFMTKNKIIKIGDFGVSGAIQEKKELPKIKQVKGTVVGSPLYMAPEILKKKEQKEKKEKKEKKIYTEKIDIFSMGCVFYEICCLKAYQFEDFQIEGDIFIKKMGSHELPTNYDNDLMDIIRLMVEKNEEKRLNSKEILKKISENYNKIFIQNSGLYAVLRCMINLPYIRSYFLNEFKKLKDDEKNDKPYSEKFLYLIENNHNWIQNLTFYRQKIIEENNFLNNNKEINPYLFLSFILDKIHGELNKVISEKGLRKKRTSFVDPTKEDKIKMDYLSSFQNKFNSIISGNFVGHLETTRTCCKCNSKTYVFTYFFSLFFDLNFPLLIKEGKKEIDLIELFRMQNNISLDLKGLKKIECVKCKKEIEQKESKMFYLFPYILVLGFDRGNNSENKLKINYKEKLDLSEIPKDPKYSSKSFDLIGIIKRCDIGPKEHYISLILNSEDNSWYLCDNEKIEKISGPSKHKDGDVLMLFYLAPKTN